MTMYKGKRRNHRCKFTHHHQGFITHRGQYLYADVLDASRKYWCVPGCTRSALNRVQAFLSCSNLHEIRFYADTSAREPKLKTTTLWRWVKTFVFVCNSWCCFFHPHLSMLNFLTTNSKSSHLLHAGSSAFASSYLVWKAVFAPALLSAVTGCIHSAEVCIDYQEMCRLIKAISASY